MKSLFAIAFCLVLGSSWACDTIVNVMSVAMERNYLIEADGSGVCVITTDTAVPSNAIPEARLWAVKLANLLSTHAIAVQTKADKICFHETPTSNCGISLTQIESIK